MLAVLYEDDYCVLVNKPNNVLVHHAHHSRNKLDEASLIQLLIAARDEKYYPIHRLDRKTSGVLLLVKKKEYVSKFQALFTNNEIQKVYYAIVRGFAPETLVIDSPVKGRDSDVYKEAETHLKRLATVALDIPVKPYASSRYSLVKLTPKTGRLHQLRIHMNKISHPIIGDPKYGDKNHNVMFDKEFCIDNLLLHAGALVFDHPMTNEPIKVKGPFSQEWVNLAMIFDWELPI